MAKKLSRKLLAVILTLAICATTVLGCLITAYAATDGTYAFSEAVVNADSTQATMELAFEIPGDVTAGMFTLNEVNYDAADHLTLVGVTAEDGINVTADTEGLDAGVIANIIVDAESKYSAITVTLTFGFSGGEATEKTYEISVSGAEFAYSVSSYYNSFTGTNGFITAGCEHVLTVTGEPLETDSTNGYSVYENSVCAKCGETFGYQVVPATEAFEDLNVAYAVGNATVGAWNGADGSFMDIDGGTAVGSGTETDPFILSTPGHFRFLAQKATYDTTHGKYFAIDPNIDIMVFQYEGYMKNNGGLDAFLALSPDEVKDFFTTNTSDRVQHQSSGGKFYGHLDGNGVEIVGMYNGNGGLIYNAGAGATFKNITVKNSYIFGAANMGAIVGDGSLKENGNGTITFENCVVANNALISSKTNGAVSSGGVLVGYTGYDNYNILSVKNCLVYGNKTGHSSENYDITWGLFGTVGFVEKTEGETTTRYFSTIEDSVILDCIPHSFNYNNNSTQGPTYKNVYTNMIGVSINNKDWNKTTTDADTSENFTFTNSIDANGNYTATITKTTTKPTGDVATYTLPMSKASGSIIYTSADDAKGLAAKNNLELDFDNTWVLDLSSGYPTPTASVADTTDRTSSSELNLKAVNLTYNDDGSFNINFYYTPAASGFVPELKVPKSDLSKYFTLTGTALGESEAAALGVKTGTLRYTIERLSAREIPDTLLPTVIYDNAGVASWGKTEAISIKDYAIAVISGEYDQADKNVAAALINYGDAAKAALETKYDGAGNAEKKVVYAVEGGTEGVDAWNLPDGRFMDVDGGTAVGSGTETDPFIISTPGQLRYIVQRSTYETTHGKYFAIDPSIDIMVLQYESTVNKNGGLDALLAPDSGEEVKTFYEATPTKAWLNWNGGAESGYEPFGGHLDGNGVQIVGLYSLNASGITTAFGIFNNVSEGASFEDITVSNCYVKSSDYAASLVGFAKYSKDYIANATNDNIYGYVSFDRITIKNNYIASTGNNARAAVLLGGTQGGGVSGSVAGVNNYIGISVSMTNCIVYDNQALGLKDTANPVNAGLFGSLSTGHNGDGNATPHPNGIYHDSIILGCVPYGIATQGQAYKPTYYKNIYTDTTMTYKPCSHGTTDDTYMTDYAGKIISIGSADKAKGSSAVASMPNLDWNTTWIYGSPGEYPTLASGDTVAETAGEIWYWDGTAEAIDTTAHAGTAADPYIIESAQQLNYVAMKISAANSTGKYYKIADGVAAIILQASGAEEIMALDSGAETKAYFESITPKNWVSTFGWVQFNGNFDGNNVPIYGLYASRSDMMIGMFPEIDGGGDGTGVNGSPTTDDVGIKFENIIIRNSYLTTTATDRRVGVITGHSYGPGYGACTNGTVNFNKIEVSNSYVYNPNAHSSSAGILGTNFDGELIKASNIIVYGNQTLTGNNTVYPMFGTANNGRTDADGNFIHNTITDSVLLGVAPYNIYNFGWRLTTADSFENVYTDAAAGTVTDWKNGTYSVTYKETDIKHIEVSDAIGEGAITACPNLDWNTDTNTDGTWYTGNAWGYPAFEAAGTMPSITQNAYDALVLSNYDEYGETNPYFSMYASSLNLKTNPYIAFTFAFTDIPGGTQYKTNRDNITVTFKTASETITTTVGDGNGGVSAGWTNNEGAGRYHLYRLEGISVEDMCKDIQVTVSYNGTDYNFGTFSVEGFALELQNANKQDPCNYYATRAEAAKALLFYTQMVNARYGA